MNNRSFEQHLRQATAPAPDPQARLDARRAALAEFQRLHSTGDEASASTRRWSRRNSLWGGLAAASVAVISLSVVWLVPTGQRVPAPLAPVVAVVRQESPALPVVEPRIQADEAPVSALPLPWESTRAPAKANLAPAQPLPASRAEVPALAQELEERVLEEISITGGRLQASTTASSPVITITGEELRRLGIVKAADMVAPSQTPTDRSSVFNSSTIANLGGLNPAFGTRTLTLVDGRRAVPVPPPLGDRFEHFEINSVKRTADEPVSTFSIDVDTASYSFVRRQLNQGVMPAADAVRAEEMINYFDYAWPAAASREQPFKPTVTVSDSPWNEGRKLIHIGIKGYQLPVRERPDVNLVLLLDVSGSMNSPDKLPLAQRSMALLLDSLKPTDTVAIAVYAGAAGEVLPPTPVREKEAILAALNSLRPGGSTAGAAGIRLAYELAQRNFREKGVNRILLATDGDFNVGISDTGELKRFVERERGKGVFLSVLGFGQGNYRDEMAQALAQNGNGVAAYIDTLQEARKVLVEEAGAALSTIAKDVKLQVEFNPATVAEYRLVGYETRSLNREDFNNDRVDAGDVGAGHVVTAIYEITPVDSPARLIDERRYGPGRAAARGREREYGFLKIRYKLPDSSESQLLEQRIAVDAGVPRAIRQDVEFATSVAGFAQLLQGGRYTGALTYEDVFSQAQRALGADAHGYRAEFVQLVRVAQSKLQASE
jgi:Ca-activated chloride channel family protein